MGFSVVLCWYNNTVSPAAAAATIFAVVGITIADATCVAVRNFWNLLYVTVDVFLAMELLRLGVIHGVEAITSDGKHHGKQTKIIVAW